jgi:hypothetical protein
MAQRLIYNAKCTAYIAIYVHEVQANMKFSLPKGMWSNPIPSGILILFLNRFATFSGERLKTIG